MINRRDYRVIIVALSGLALSCAALAMSPQANFNQTDGPSVSSDQVAVHASAPEPMFAPLREIGEASIQPWSSSGTTILDHQRGALLYVDTFDRYPISDDPVFDRFQISMHGRSNGAGGSWTAFDREFLTTLFVDGQLDSSGAPDPLPRWFGADLDANIDQALVGDLSGDFVVDTTDLGVLIGSFGQSGPGIDSDINGDGLVDTADLGIMIGAFGNSIGPFCLYEVDRVRESSPAGDIISQTAINSSPAVGDVIAVPASEGLCGACVSYRFLPHEQTERVYGEWTLVDSEAIDAGLADLIAFSQSQACSGWGDEATLTLARTESDINVPNCCFFSLFSPLARQTSATPLQDVVTDVELFLTGHQTFLWLQAYDNGLRASWDVMTGGVALFLDPNLLPFADANGELPWFIVRQSPQVPGAGQGLFYGTVPDAITGAVGKEALLGEWFTMRMVQHADSTFELWVSDSETALLNDPIPGDDSDGVSSDGFARLVPSGPYGPAIWNMQAGSPAPNPFLVATPALRQLQWLWGGDPSPAEDPDYKPANWFMDNIRITGPF